MPKGYKDRAMKKEPADERVFFFPKANPPVSIKARSREDAAKKLKAKSNKENE